MCAILLNYHTSTNVDSMSFTEHHFSSLFLSHLLSTSFLISSHLSNLSLLPTSSPLLSSLTPYRMRVKA